MINIMPVIASVSSFLTLQALNKNKEDYKETLQEKERNKRMKIIALQEESLSCLFKSWEKRLAEEEKK